MIGLFVQPDRWTCPSCGLTEVVDAQTPAEAAARLRAVQLEHIHRPVPESPNAAAG